MNAVRFKIILVNLPDASLSPTRSPTCSMSFIPFLGPWGCWSALFPRETSLLLNICIIDRVVLPVKAKAVCTTSRPPIPRKEMARKTRRKIYWNSSYPSFGAALESSRSKARAVVKVCNKYNPEQRLCKYLHQIVFISSYLPIANLQTWNKRYVQKKRWFFWPTQVASHQQ